MKCHRIIHDTANYNIIFKLKYTYSAYIIHVGRDTTLKYMLSIVRLITKVQFINIIDKLCFIIFNLRDI